MAWLIGFVAGCLWVYLPATEAVRAQQNFNAAATVTALVETRTAILAILTGTPPAPVAGAPANNAAPTVTIKVRGLNVRSGPGTNYGVIANVNAGKILTIVGSAANCNWLQVQENGRDLGWISGGSQFVTVTAPCATLPVTAAPLAPTPVPTPTPVPATNVATEGCYVLINQLGFKLTITLSRSDGWTDTFSLSVGSEREYCAPPGDYQYTLQAPGALGAIQGTLTIKAGERNRLPLKLGN
jgi:hypothetical protein